MDIEELRAEKLYEAKREMYAEMEHERKMAEDSEYALEYILDEYESDIDKAKEILGKVSKELFEAGLDIKDWQILKEYL